MTKQLPEQARHVIETAMAIPAPSPASSVAATETAYCHTRVQDPNIDTPLEQPPSQAHGMWCGLTRFLTLAAFLSAQVLPVVAQENGCASISQAKLTALKLDWYSVAPIEGGLPLQMELKVDESYVYQPMFALGGPSESTALFQMNYVTGQPITYQEQVKPLQTGHLMLQMTAHGYARPEYGLGSFSDTYSGPPLTWPAYQRTGNMLGDFLEIRVEGHAKYYLDNFDLAAEFAPDGSMTALLSCTKPTYVIRPICSIKATVGRWDTLSTFLRSDLNALPGIRRRVENFIYCIDEGGQN